MTQPTIYKFGGTSMGSYESLSNIISIIESVKNKLIIVVSATSGTTDELLKLAKIAKQNQTTNLDKLEELKSKHLNILKNFEVINNSPINKLFEQLKDALTNPIFVSEIETNRYLDYICSFGERLSANLLNLILASKGLDSDFVDSRQFLTTDENFTAANILHPVSQKNTQNFFANTKTKISVVTGFIARSSSGATTTLGRGGSDYTASLLANYLDCPEVFIWTDVSGVFSTDPRICPQATVVQNLSFSEAFEVAYYGGKVLYPKTMEACQPKNIAIQVKNTFEPTAHGTVVSQTCEPGIKVVTRSKNNILVEIIFAGKTSQIGLLAQIFGQFAEEKITIDVVSTSGDSVSFTCDKAPTASLQTRIKQEIGELKIWENQEVVAIIGTNILEDSKYPELVAKIIEFKPKTVMVNTKQTNLTAIVEPNQGEILVKNLHNLIF
jgi:aspartate kinase